MENEVSNILDILLDEDNRDPVTLVDAAGNALEFEQIAVIPYSGKLYCVLKPLTKIEGVGDDEAIVFRVDEVAGEEPALCVETDERTAITVFNIYYDLLEEDE